MKLNSWKLARTLEFNPGRSCQDFSWRSLLHASFLPLPDNQNTFNCLVEAVRLSSQWYGIQRPTAYDSGLTARQPSNLPNLRRLFVEARTEAEESAYSRNAVGLIKKCPMYEAHRKQFYNLVLFMSSVAIFSLVAQRMNGQR